MPKVKTAFTAAAAELAAQLGNRYWSNEITADEARGYVDTDVMAVWIAHEACDRDDEIIVGDTLAQRLTKDQARTLLCAVAIDHAAKVLEVVKGAVIEQIARDLAYEANQLVANFDPTDAEMARSSYASQVADPVRDDRCALAKLSR